MTANDFLNLIRALMVMAQITAVVFVVVLIAYIVLIVKERKGKKR